MSDKTIKDIRKQVRGVVQEVLPQILESEFGATLYKKILADMTVRLDEMAKNIGETLKRVDDRSKDTMSYLVSQSTVQKPVEPANE